MPKVTVAHRGADRSVVLEVDTTRGQLAIRLNGCRTRRIYSIKDLWNWKVPQLQLALHESDIRPSEILSEEEALAGFAEMRKSVAAIQTAVA
jgi:hypothetical protein